MSNEEHHQGALLETARTELEPRPPRRPRHGRQRGQTGAPTGALRRLAGRLRRVGETGAAPPDERLGRAMTELTKALADLDGGALAEMGTLIEDVRTLLA